MSPTATAGRQYPPKPTDVYLFATCLVDQFAPQAGLDTVNLLEREGIRVHYAEAQTCCGQPAYSSGYPEEARSVVAACKFAPLGERSAAGNWPHVNYRPGEARALREAFNAATTVVVMLESPEAVARADEIAAVPGVDILHIGTVDLCDALGRPADYGHPEVMACHERVIRACQRHGKVAGAGGLAHTPALVQQVVAMGARFVTAGVDWDLMMAGVRQRVGSLRALRV